MIIFCACKNLLNNEKANKNTKIVVLKGRKQFFVKGNPWKQNGNTVMAAVLIPEIVNNWKACYRQIFKKQNYTIVSQTGVYMAYMFDVKSEGKTSQIEWLFE